MRRKFILISVLGFIQSLFFIACSKMDDEMDVVWDSTNTYDLLDGKAFMRDTTEVVKYEVLFGSYNGYGGYSGAGLLEGNQLYFSKGKIFVEPPIVFRSIHPSYPTSKEDNHLADYCRNHRLYWWTEIGSYSIDPMTNELLVQPNSQYLEEAFPSWNPKYALNANNHQVYDISKGHLELMATVIVDYTNRDHHPMDFIARGLFHVYFHEIKDHSNFVYLNTEQEMNDYAAPYLEKAMEEFKKKNPHYYPN